MTEEETSNKKAYLKVNFINVESNEYKFEVVELSDKEAFELWNELEQIHKSGRLILLKDYFPLQRVYGETEKDTEND